MEDGDGEGNGEEDGSSSSDELVGVTIYKGVAGGISREAAKNTRKVKRQENMLLSLPFF